MQAFHKQLAPLGIRPNVNAKPNQVRRVKFRYYRYTCLHENAIAIDPTDRVGNTYLIYHHMTVPSATPKPLNRIRPGEKVFPGGGKIYVDLTWGDGRRSSYHYNIPVWKPFWKKLHRTIAFGRALKFFYENPDHIPSEQKVLLPQVTV